MGIMQHHQAITGVTRQYVADDYLKHLYAAIDACEEQISESLNNLSSIQGSGFPQLEYQTCLDMNISSCELITRGNNFIITLYNPMASDGFQYVRVPVLETNYEVRDADNNLIDCEFVPVPDTVRELPTFKGSATHEILFNAEGIPSLGFKSFYVEKIRTERPVDEFIPNNEEFNISSSVSARDFAYLFLSVLNFTNLPQYFNVTFDRQGTIRLIEGNGARLVGTQQFVSCNSDDSESESLPFADHEIINCKWATRYTAAQVKVYRNSVLQEVHQIFTPWLSQIVRVYYNKNTIDLEWQVGPIDTSDGIGKDIYMVFDTDMKDGTTCQTDSNGREFVTRYGNQSYGAGYPISTQVQVMDETRRLAILSDRGQYVDCRPGSLILGVNLNEMK